MRPHLFRPVALRDLVNETLFDTVRRYRHFNDRLDWHQRHCRMTCGASCECDCHAGVTNDNGR